MKPWRSEALANLKLALPLVGAQLSGVGMAATDTIFCGQLGEQALTAVAVGANLNTVPFMLHMGLFMAVSARVSSRRGAGEGAAQIGAFVSALLPAAIALGVLWSVLLTLLAPMIVAPLGLSAGTQALAVDYLRCYAFTGLGLAPWFALRYTAEGMACTRPVLWVALGGLLLNALLNPILIWGWGGIPALGAKGSGLATAIACVAMAVVMRAVFAWHGALSACGLRLWPASWAQTREALGEVASLGLPIGVTLLAEAGLFVVVGLMMAAHSEQWAAAHQVAMNIAAVAFMLPLGLGLATTVRVGFYRGAGDAALARRAGWVGMGLSVLCAAANAATMLLAGPEIIGLYSSNAALIATAWVLLQFAAGFQLVDALQVTAASALRGLQDSRMPMALTLSAYWLMGLPVALWLGDEHHLGPQGLWLGLGAGLGAAAVSLGWRFHRLSKAGF